MIGPDEGAHRADAHLVVFVPWAGLPWLKFLRPGFRHCFAIALAGPHWILCDGLSNALVLAVVDQRTVCLQLAELCRKGVRIVPVAGTPEFHPRKAPIGLQTCVETVKRLLGIRSLYVHTPWQLFNFLRNTK